MTPRLQVDAVRKSFGRGEVLRGASFEVGAGEIVAIVGENGAGRSTLLRIVAGLLRSGGGTALRHDLATIFAIVVLTNIDLGWLQNPVVYHGAQNRWVIRALPGYFPAQTAFLAELTNETLGMTIVRALTWGIALLLGASLLYIHRMRLHR